MRSARLGRGRSLGRLRHPRILLDICLFHLDTILVQAKKDVRVISEGIRGTSVHEGAGVYIVCLKFYHVLSCIQF